MISYARKYWAKAGQIYRRLKERLLFFKFLLKCKLLVLTISSVDNPGKIKKRTIKWLIRSEGTKVHLQNICTFIYAKR